MRFCRYLDPMGPMVLVFLLSPLALGGQAVSELPNRDQSIGVEATEVFSVGSLAGEEWETFSRVSGVAFDAEGNLYLLDADNFRVVKVDGQGRLVAEMGKKGGGPGEFGMPMGFAVTPLGEVRVFDFGNQGFVLFDPDGEFKTTIPLGGGEMMVVPYGSLFVLPNGGMVPAEDAGLRSGPDGWCPPLWRDRGG